MAVYFPFSLNLSKGYRFTKVYFSGWHFRWRFWQDPMPYFFGRPRKTTKINKFIKRLLNFHRLRDTVFSWFILSFYWNCIYRIEIANCSNRNITGSSLVRRDLFASIRKWEVNLNTRSNTICHESVCFFEVLHDQTRYIAIQIDQVTL